MTSFQKWLLILVGIFLIWLFAFLFYYDTYYFHMSDTMLSKGNKRTGEVFLWAKTEGDKYKRWVKIE